MSFKIRKHLSMVFVLLFSTLFDLKYLSAQNYIKNFVDFPAYPYNTASYRQGGAFVGCGPTTGAMIFGYFDNVYGLSSDPILTDPVNGVNEGLSTAWILHGTQYMKTGSDGFGSVYDIKPGLENYAASRGHKVGVVIHVSPSYSDPSGPGADWLNAYGAYGEAWLNDGIFWRESNGNWSIDIDDFCDFMETKLTAGVPIFLTIDTDENRSGDHWVALIGFDRGSGRYAFYDTYDTMIHWADIHYCDAPGPTKDNSISLIRSVSYEGPSEPIALEPPVDLIALSGYSNAVPLAWNLPAGVQMDFSPQENAYTEKMPLPVNERKLMSNRLNHDQGSLLDSHHELQFVLSKQNTITSPVNTTALQGFNVYRSASQNGSYIKIAENIFRQYYRDESVINGQIYYYKVTALYHNDESSFSNIESGQPQSNGYLIKAGWVTSDPSVDGSIHDDEWSAATVVDITYPGDSGPVTLYVMNNENRLYLAVDDVRDNSLDNLDQLAIFFDNNLNREWPVSTPTEEGNLWLAWNSDSNSSFALFGPRAGYWPDHLEWPERLTPSSVSQSISIASGHVQYEGSIALDTSPLNVSPGHVIGFLVFTYDYNKLDFNSFWPQQAEKLKSITPDIQYWGQAPFSFGDLILATPTAPAFPDLIVTEIQNIDGEAPEISFRITLTNIGTGSTNSTFRTGIYLSSNNIITGDDYRIHDWDVESPLNPEESISSDGITLAISGIPAGSYYLGVITDTDNSISELDEDNNSLVSASPIITIPDDGEATGIAIETPAMDVYDFHLTQNYPNPFNPVTQITYSIPRTGFVSLKIYDLLGHEAATLVNEIRTAGEYTITWDAYDFPNGIYLCRIDSEGLIEIKKMILQK